MLRVCRDRLEQPLLRGALATSLGRRLAVPHTPCHAFRLFCPQSLAGVASSAASSSAQRRSGVPYAGPGQELSAASVEGMGRQLQAATGRSMAAATAGAVLAAQRDAAAAAERQHRAARRAQQQQQRGEAGGQSRWDPISLLLAPAAPLLAGLSAMRREDAAGNKYDMLLDLLQSAAVAPATQVTPRGEEEVPSCIAAS